MSSRGSSEGILTCIRGLLNRGFSLLFIRHAMELMAAGELSESQFLLFFACVVMMRVLDDRLAGPDKDGSSPKS